ncbi:TPA: hypothetical protein ACONTJ_005755, partial [Escherichia coli]
LKNSFMFDALLVCLVTQWYITIIKAGWRWCIMLKRPSLSVLSDSPVHRTTYPAGLCLGYSSLYLFLQLYP